jgi:hypothetical protein
MRSATAARSPGRKPIPSLHDGVACGLCRRGRRCLILSGRRPAALVAGSSNIALRCKCCTYEEQPFSAWGGTSSNLGGVGKTRLRQGLGARFGGRAYALLPEPRARASWPF